MNSSKAGRVSNFKGHKHSKESKQKISESVENQWTTNPRPAWNKGLTKETDARVKNHSLSMTGKKQTPERIQHRITLCRGRKRSPEVCEGISKRMKAGQAAHMLLLSGQLKPTKPEKLTSNIIQELSLPNMKYVGDGAFWIGNKNPDFVDTNNKHIIEVFGDYWHKQEDVTIRTEHFAKYGYKTLIIWEHELKNMNNVKNMIVEFTMGGA